VLALTGISLVTQATAALALSQWSYDPTTQQLEVMVKAGVTPKYFVMAQPARIVVDLPDTEMGDVKPKESFTGAIRQVRVSQFQPGVTRVVLELAPEVELAPGQVKLEAKGDRWVLRPLIADNSTLATQPAKSPSLTTKPEQVAKLEPAPPAKAVTQPGKAAIEPLPPSPVTATTAAPLPMGSDVSPVTVEPPVPSVSVPPLATTASVPLAVSVPPLATPNPPEPSATLAKPSVSPLAQLPPEATTPLPPATDLPPSNLIEGRESVTISVPPPVSLSTVSPEIVIQAPTKGTPAPIAKPIPVAPALPALEIPSTARSLPTTSTPQVTVPTLPPLSQPVVPSVQPQAIPAPAPISVPPLSPVTLPATPSPVLKPPVSSVITTTGIPTAGTVRTQQVMPGSMPMPTAPTPPPAVVKQPPTSWVMQSSGLSQPTGLSQPSGVSVPPSMTSVPPAIATPAAPPPTSPKVTPPPTSWVMQSSGLPQPSLVQPLPQPPISSVIQPMSAQPPVAVAPVPPSRVVQPTVTPAPGGAVTPTVSVPPLQSFPAATPPMPSVSVPPLQAAPAQPTTMPTPGNPAGVIEFGKPLPTKGAASLNTMPMGIPTTAIAANSAVGSPQVIPPTQTGVVQSMNPAISLPVGTVLSLSYPGVTELQLDPANPRQEMMVLQTEVRDAAGNVVFPRGSYVMGRFEPGGSGSKFVASAIQRGDRIVPFLAESDSLTGGREISAGSMALYSGAGALAGGLVSKFSAWGLLLGGAAGAATNYFTTPKPTGVVQPGQVIPVRMLQDIP